MANGGFHIDKRAIAKMSKEIEREFAKHPVRVPIETDQSAISGMPATSSVTKGLEMNYLFRWLGGCW